MNALKKYEYISPETEILSLETDVILEVSGLADPNTGGTEGSVGGGLHAPWRL